MRKLIVIAVLMGAGLAFAETATIAAGATTATFTNASSSQTLFIYNVAVNSATATNDTFSVQVTKDSTDFQVGTVSTTTNSVHGNAVITNKVLVSPLGVYKIVRAVTNFSANVFVDIRD